MRVASWIWVVHCKEVLVFEFAKTVKLMTVSILGCQPDVVSDWDVFPCAHQWLSPIFH
jgi:hypothetical protein